MCTPQHALELLCTCITTVCPSALFAVQSPTLLSQVIALRDSDFCFSPAALCALLWSRMCNTTKLGNLSNTVVDFTKQKHQDHSRLVKIQQMGLRQAQL